MKVLHFNTNAFANGSYPSNLNNTNHLKPSCYSNANLANGNLNLIPNNCNSTFNPLSTHRSLNLFTDRNNHVSMMIPTPAQRYLDTAAATNQIGKAAYASKLSNDNDNNSNNNNNLEYSNSSSRRPPALPT